ncbi:hypothetical protein D3C75_470830 [compost metagenome]
METAAADASNQTTISGVVHDQALRSAPLVGAVHGQYQPMGPGGRRGCRSPDHRATSVFRCRNRASGAGLGHVPDQHLVRRRSQGQCPGADRGRPEYRAGHESVLHHGQLHPRLGHGQGSLELRLGHWCTGAVHRHYRQYQRPSRQNPGHGGQRHPIRRHAGDADCRRLSLRRAQPHRLLAADLRADRCLQRRPPGQPGAEHLHLHADGGVHSP